MKAFGYAGVYDEITSDGTKVKRWEQEILLGTSHSGGFDSSVTYTSDNFTPIRRIYVALNKKPKQIYSKGICVGYDGVPLYDRYNDSEKVQDNQFFVYGPPAWQRVYLYLPTSATGWDWNYAPNIDDVKAFLNGWKANGYSTTGSVTAEATGLLADESEYTFANAGKYKNITVQKSTDDSTYESAEEGVDYVLLNIHSTAKLKNISGSSLYFKISYDYGVTANSWIGLDGTAPAENTLSYVSTTTLRDQNPDTWWRPYVIIYQLAKPEIVQLDYSGELILHPGQNNIIITDVETPVAISIKGAKKYLEG